MPLDRGSNLERARTLKQQGRLGEAAALCQEVLATQPDVVEALLLLAEICVAQGEREQAITRYSRVIELRPDQALAFYKRGNLLKDLEELEAAVADYDRAIALEPGYAYALCNRGVVLSRLHRLEEALDSYDRASAIAPDDALVFFNRAEVLRELTRSEQALASYDRAIAIQPAHLHSHCNRGLLLAELGRFTESQESFNRALAISTSVPQVYFGRGKLLERQKRLGEALADYGQATRLDPKLVAAHSAQGRVLMELERWDEALASLDRAVSLEPDSAELHLMRADVFMNTRRDVEAIQAYEQALVRKPDGPFIRGILQHCKMLTCGWDDLAVYLERLIDSVGRGKTVTSPFPALAVVDDVSLHHDIAKIWVRETCPANHELPALLERPAPEKLRIGYFSGDFYDHPVAVLTAELFEIHDRSRFEITAFSLGANRPSPMRRRLEQGFDRFIDAHVMPDRDVALLARSHGIDIAVDLSGHTARARTGIFARRAAPLQVAWLGYPGTLGADYFDYLIGDPTVIPPEHQSHYSEKIAYLPHSYLPNDSTRTIDATPGREAEGLPAGAVVFCSFNNSYKITPEVFSSWMRILARVEHSVLWLSQNNPAGVSNLAREAERHGIVSRRLIYSRRTPSVSQHLARLRLADLFLDTLPYNAHTTAIDALWTGVPVVTRIGQSFAGRVAASLLRSIELPDLVTTSVQQYEDLAVTLGTNPARLAEYKERLAHNRLTTPLFDSRSFVRSLEAVYLKIHARQRAGLPPDHII